MLAGPAQGHFHELKPTPRRSIDAADLCTTCCSTCTIERRESRFLQGSTTEISLEHLLCAGSITIPLITTGDICTHQHAEDGLHALTNTIILRPYLAVQDFMLLDSVSFLMRHSFLISTFKLTSSRAGITVRIYLVPYDLPGSKGSLRTRDEDKVVRPARGHLRAILSWISRNPSSWLCKDEVYGLPSLQDSFFPHSQDQRSLSQIFNDLTTTNVDESIPESPYLRTALYGYQKESVATMLSMETASRVTDDPLYVSVTGIDGKTFFLQPTTLELLLQRPRSFQTRGGILCEEMGTGKTVMTLALILATLDVLPDPPEHDGADVLTPVAYRHFPQYAKFDLNNKRQLASSESLERFPSLNELLCHYIRVHPDNSDLRLLDDTKIWEQMRKNTPFFFHRGEDCLRQASSRRQKPLRPRLTYLTTATMIVVPATLQEQWYSEILKHCSSAIRTLVIKTRKDIPPPLTLASDYDIVLVNYNFISIEAKNSKDQSSLAIGFTCQCPDSLPPLRIPDCKCQPAETISSLLKVRWKRLVRDEGHNSASQTTELNHFLRALSAERRWIVTGTPTTNLLGLNFGSNTVGNLEDNDDSRSVEEPQDFPTVYNLYGLDPVVQTLEAEEETEERLGELQYSVKNWSRADRLDLRKLGLMMSNFLGVLPFASDADSFVDLVVTGLMNDNGPLPGTPRVLEQVMKANMVRHRISDIERYVRLPPLHKETILMELDEYGKMTYNVLLAFVAVNAVDSEREDMDYLFHPIRTADLALAIQNLSQSLFWRFDENSLDNDLYKLIHRAEEAIENARSRGQPEEDIQLVKNAIIHLEKAFRDQQFRDMQHGLEVPYRVTHASQSIKEAWGLLSHRDCSRNDAAPFFVYPSYALEMRDAIMRQPLISEESLSERAYLVRARNHALAAFVEARKSKADKREDMKGSPEKRKQQKETQANRTNLNKARATAAVDEKEKLQELHAEFRKAQERLKAEAAEEEYERGGPPVSSSTSHYMRPPDVSSAREQLLRESPYIHIRVGNSTSSKLNYILEEVRKHAATEKILIFSSQPFNLVHISEGLDLMGVKYLHFMNETTRGKGKGPQRDQWLTTFETSETYRVFLMELKYGARGLNIVSASRVIFCEPVWHADVESQAIKRVHRMGQIRPVTVKTLAIRSTFEEYMLQRRHDLKESGSKTPGLVEERGIRHYLQNPVFLESPKQDIVNLDFPLLNISGELADPGNEAKEVEAVVGQGDENGDVLMGNSAATFGDSTDVDQPTPKRRRVHFG